MLNLGKLKKKKKVRGTEVWFVGLFFFLGWCFRGFLWFWGFLICFFFFKVTQFHFSSVRIFLDSARILPIFQKSNGLWNPLLSSADLTV